MKFFKDLKISVQLLIGFGFMFLIVIFLGFVSYEQARKLNEQTEILYNHPFKVRQSIDNLKNQVMSIRIATRDLLIEDNPTLKIKIEQSIKNSEAIIAADFEVLHSQFMGSKKELDDVRTAFINWNSVREEGVKLIEKGQVDSLKRSLQSTGLIGQHYQKLLSEINDVETFAINKTDELYIKSTEIKEQLNRQLILFVFLILILLALIAYVVVASIRKPIKELNRASKQFGSGDYSTRSQIISTNEFGELSNSFNLMVESIQRTSELTKKTTKLSELMLLEENPKDFFELVLPALAKHTNSQLVAVYLLNEDKTHYVHYHSFGLEKKSHVSFSVNLLEGEFGAVISTRKMQRIKKIPIDTQFSFQTVSGKIIPREIISIPIVSGSEMIAIVSLASIRSYSDETINLLDTILTPLSTRIAGVSSYQKLQDLSKRLTKQNSELEIQKNELSAQSVELLEQNRELEIQKRQLREASQLKTNFLANMSHELRTPLNSVIALSGVLSRRLTDKIGVDEYSYLEVIERNGKHLLSLINDVLDISRIEAGREEIELIQFNTNNMIDEIVAMIQPQAKEKNIELIQSPNSQSVLIHTDRNKTRHILQNLIGNAVKFTEKGKVEIAVQKINEKVEISIQDTGIGISEKNISHIFDEFRQADASTSRRYGGTGLGLAIARKYAHLLGAEIAVTSTQGKGSTFTLILPIEYSEKNIVSETLEPIQQLNRFTFDKPIISTVKNSKTILLVDDSEPAIIQMKDFLMESGYNIKEAHNATEALELIDFELPDAMILDLMMPDIDGFSVLQILRESDNTAHIPILILTAKHITKADLAHLKRNNIQQLIQKGDVNKNELLKAIESMLFVTQPVKPILPIQSINGKPKVLIVEDNVDNMITVKAIIGNKYEIVEAVDGKEAVTMAKKHLPHFILMDIALPGVDGIQAFKKIRQIGELQHVPIIALTASAMTSERETILAFGFDAYIAKPIDEKEFFQTIDRVLLGK